MWSVQIQMVMFTMIMNFVMKYKNPNQFVTVRQKMKKYVFINDRLVRYVVSTYLN